MSASMCKKIQFQILGLSSSSSSSSSPVAEEEQETMLLHKKQGIVTVLGSDFNRDRASATTSLRRTLSATADMSSEKWVSHDSFSSASEGEEDEVEEEERFFKLLSTIQGDNKDQKHHDDENKSSPPPEKLTTWSSILFDKAKEESSNDSVKPYIHPLVKRSKSALSEKSLEICTESLGSETGSDHVFSSDNSNSSSQSETEDSEDDKEEQQQPQHEEEEEHLQVPKQNLHHVVMRKSMARCFPPPLPSLHMRSHRDGNGRLFLEAVTVASQNNNFSAQRQDGRLVLTFSSDEEEEEEEEEEEKDEVDEEFEEEFVGFEEDDDVEEGKEYEEDENYEDEVVEVEAVMEEEPLLSSGVVTSNVHRLALMVNKPIGMVNMNTKKWSEKFNKVVNFEGGVVEKHHGLVAQSLPPRPRVVARLIPSAPPLAPVAASAASAAGSLNAYDCYWGTKHTSEVEQNKYSSSVVMKNNDRSRKVIFYGDVNYWNSSDGDQQNLVVMRGKNGDYLVHKSKSYCKDSRRSFLFWEPRCIAT